MKISCPNCDATYLINSTQSNSIGQNVQCSYCSQEWFQYNFYKKNKLNTHGEKNLKKLALEEYQLSKNKIQETKQANETKNVSDNVKSRIQESSNRLKETKKPSVDIESSNLVSNTRINHWTVLGFSTASLICVTSFIFYTFNSYLQTTFPSTKKILLSYKIFVDQIIRVLSNFYFQSSQILL